MYRSFTPSSCSGMTRKALVLTAAVSGSQMVLLKAARPLFLTLALLTALTPPATTLASGPSVAADNTSVTVDEGQPAQSSGMKACVGDPALGAGVSLGSVIEDCRSGGNALSAVNLPSAATQSRRVVFMRSWSSSGNHMLRARMVDPSRHPGMNIVMLRALRIFAAVLVLVLACQLPDVLPSQAGSPDTPDARGALPPLPVRH